MIVGRLRSFEHESNGTLKYFLDRFTALYLLSVVSITHKRHKFKQMDAGCAWEVHYRIHHHHKKSSRPWGANGRGNNPDGACLRL